jgi:hypothetical protein
VKTSRRNAVRCLRSKLREGFGGIYVRTNANKIESLEADFLRTEIYQVYLREPILSGFGSLQKIKSPIKPHRFPVKRLVSHPGDDYILTNMYPPKLWERTEEVMRLEMDCREDVGALLFQHKTRWKLRILGRIGGKRSCWFESISFFLTVCWY